MATTGCCEQSLASLGATAEVRGWVSPVTYARLMPGDVVLELGSACGIEPLIAAAKVGPDGRVIDVKPTESTFERARSEIAASGLDNVDVRRGTADRLPVAGDSVDWAIADCAVNLAADKRRAFAEIFRVLKPGGRMWVAEIVAEAGSAIHRNELPRDSCLASARSEDEYTACIRLCGLTDISVGGRYVYDRDQLANLGGGAAHITEEFVGQVWSVWLGARKPAGKADERGREPHIEEERQ